jgi:alkanesulfonate monooxygenase SsuD/methylene tetrahydromethanopterin reductase-like flavin-dependent oxidoreductase (luciferase family)
VRLGVTFDLRNPGDWRRPWPEVYAAALDFAAEADRLGLDVAAGEHHFWDDGYIPQPLTFLAAVAARTERARLATSVLIAPLHHEVELAEQAAVLDCLSGGRLELGLGTGYRAPEFEAFGADIAHRLRTFEDRVLRLRELWSGGVTPPPVQDTIPLWGGLRGPRGARLAGRLGMGMLYLPEAPWESYLRGIAEAGDGVRPRFAGPVYAVLADDPERAFAQLAPRIEDHWRAYDRHAVQGTDAPLPDLLTAADYRRIGPFAAAVDPADPDSRRTLGFGIFTPAEAADAIVRVAAGRSPDWAYFPAAVGGVFDDVAYRHLELIATELRPLVDGL